MRKPFFKTLSSKILNKVGQFLSIYFFNPANLDVKDDVKCLLHIQNESYFSDYQLKKIAKFCSFRLKPVSQIIVRKSRDSFFGKFYHRKSKIVVGVASKSLFPMYITRSPSNIEKGYATEFELKNPTEALIYVLAHEMRHDWQRRNRHKVRLDKTHIPYSEKDADMFALKCLEKYRKSCNE